MEIIVCTFSRVKNTKGSSWGRGGEHIYINPKSFGILFGVSEVHSLPIKENTF